jgi:hypothetical protein
MDAQAFVKRIGERVSPVVVSVGDELTPITQSYNVLSDVYFLPTGNWSLVLCAWIESGLN